MKKILSVVLICFAACGAVSHNESAPPSKLVEKAKRSQRQHAHEVKKKNRLVIIDYSLPVFQKRLWVINPQTNAVLFHGRVGHAGRSGIIYATVFSNRGGSNQSSVGSFITMETYHGKYGYSLNVRGLERGVNSNAYKRRIVFHQMTNYPWSRGCFTIPQVHSRRVINMIKDGIFVYVAP